MLTLLRVARTWDALKRLTASVMPRKAHSPPGAAEGVQLSDHRRKAHADVVPACIVSAGTKPTLAERLEVQAAEV